jgi:hypothetical protein
LKLHFNSLDDLFAVGSNGVAFKDLVTPSSRELGQDQSQPGPTRYNPDYFRIKVVVGYAEPMGKLWENQKELVKQVGKIKRVFYLTLVKHDLDFRDNGAMSLNIEYHAYAEKALQQDDADVFRALLSKEDRQTLDDAANNYKKATKKPSEGEKCKDEDAEESRVKRIESTEKSLLRIKGKAYSALMGAMFEKEKIYTIHVTDKKSIGRLENNGADVRIKKHGKGEQDNAAWQEQNRQQEAIKAAISNTDKDNLLMDDRNDDVDDAIKSSVARDNYWSSWDSLSSDEYRFDYFYLGELLDVAFEMINEEKGKFQNAKFVLGDVPYLDTDTGTLKHINISKVPVSMNVYSTWFLDSVVRTGQRDTYPINDFVRDLFNNLVQPMLAPKGCEDDEMSRCSDLGTIRPTFSAEIFEIPLLASGLCPLTRSAMSQKFGDISVSNLPKLPDPLPLAGNATYVYYYAKSTAESVFVPQAGESREEGDNKRGIYHFRAARNRGLVKSVKFKKQDQKYLKEARMVKDGGTSSGVLRERYNANIVMNGFPTLRPGMLAYVPPDSFGVGSSSMANELGIGGYYSIIKVLNRIDGKFETEIECSWQSNGTGKQDESCCAPEETPCDQSVDNEKKKTNNPKKPSGG